MIKNAWEHALSNPATRVQIIIVILLLGLFAGLFLGSMWDPYGNAKNLKVAVVNYDNRWNLMILR